MAQHLYTFDDPPSEKDLGTACRILKADGVLAYPTDLNWAFGCDAASPKALERIRRLKPTHPRQQPFSLLCSSISMAAEVGHISNSAYRVLRKAWPGPYTILLTSTRTLPRQIKDKRRVVGVRIPQSPLILALVERFGHPLATTSVPSITGADDPEGIPRFGYQVEEAYGHALDLILDLGTELSGQETTIVDFTESVPTIVRVGEGDPNLFEVGV